MNKNGTLTLAETLLIAKTKMSQADKDVFLKTMRNVKLLAPDSSNAKLGKNSKYETDSISYIMYLSPAETAFKYLSRKGTMCPKASDGCKRLCLSQGGRAKMDRSETVGISGARLRKTLYYILFNKEFMSQVDTEIKRLKVKLAKQGKRLAVRLNGTSDVSFKRIIMSHPDVQFYDYTAVPNRAITDSCLNNYHVTFSYKENNHDDCLRMLRAGVNVAVPFQADLYESIGDTIKFQGETFKVVDGSSHDMRFLDPSDSIGYIVKLKEIKTKKSKNDTDGFIVRDLTAFQSEALPPSQNDTLQIGLAV